jgi:hypothetical protein
VYTRTNYRTKKAVREAVKAGERVEVFQPGPFAPDGPVQGDCMLEGPHYPEPHRWYARVRVKDGVVVKVLG